MLESALEEELTRKVRALCETKQAVEAKGMGNGCEKHILPLLGERKGTNMIEKFKTLRSSLTITIISTSIFRMGKWKAKVHQSVL
jgi:hypothetical protein